METKYIYLWNLCIFNQEMFFKLIMLRIFNDYETNRTRFALSRRETNQS